MLFSKHTSTNKTEQAVQSYAAGQEDLYNNAKEPIPSDMPKLKGCGFKIRAFVDSDHAGDVSTRRSRTGSLCCHLERLILLEVGWSATPM